MWATFWSYDRHRGWTKLEKDCIRLTPDNNHSYIAVSSILPVRNKKGTKTTVEITD